MSKINPQKGAIEISSIAAIIITAAIVGTVSIIATIKYYDVLNIESPVAGITPKLMPRATQASAINAEIADWKIYKNEEYGFEVKYPRDASFSSNEEEDNTRFDIIGFGNQENYKSGDDVLEVNIVKLPLNTDFQQWWKENVVCEETEPLCFYPVSYDPEKVELNGYSAFKVFVPFGGYGDTSVDRSAYYLQKENYIYNIVVVPSWKENIATVNQILSTFKFIKIEKDETENWQTYTNEKYGFELFFPVSWKGVRRVISDDVEIETILFELPTSDKTWEHGSGFSEMFSLNVELKEEWFKTHLEKDLNSQYIYNNNKYVFEFNIFGNQTEDLSDIDISEVVSTFHFIDRVTFGSLSAYTKRETDYNYVILSERGKETIVDKKTADLDFSFPDFGIEEYGNFGDLVFSPKGNYLLYSEAGHEYIASNVYEIKNKKKILTTSADSETGVGFTPDEKYFYACAWSGMGSTPGGLIYNIPDFKVVHNTLSSTSCRYELESDSVIFFQDLGRGIINDTVRYSLKEQKEYMLNK